MTETIADTIYQELSQQIITGTIGPGEKLRQDHIATQFNTSHVPVREALLRLEAHGLAEHQPRRGMRVTALNAYEIREVIEMRVVLETLALQYSVQNMTPAALEKIEAARVHCDEATDMPSWEARNRVFHRAILTPCSMPRLLHSIDDLHIASARHLFAHWRLKWAQREDVDHLQIVNALKRRDASAACTILRKHLRRVS